MVIRRLKDTREDVPEDVLEKAKKSGVVQKDSQGKWRIVSIKNKKYWNAHYKTKESAQSALRAYQANK